MLIQCSDLRTIADGLSPTAPATLGNLTKPGRGRARNHSLSPVPLGETIRSLVLIFHGIPTSPWSALPEFPDLLAIGIGMLACQSTSTHSKGNLHILYTVDTGSSRA